MLIETVITLLNKLKKKNNTPHFHPHNFLHFEMYVLKELIFFNCTHVSKVWGGRGNKEDILLEMFSS